MAAARTPLQRAPVQGRVRGQARVHGYRYWHRDGHRYWNRHGHQRPRPARRRCSLQRLPQQQEIDAAPARWPRRHADQAARSPGHHGSGPRRLRRRLPHLAHGHRRRHEAHGDERGHDRQRARAHLRHRTDEVQVQLRRRHCRARPRSLRRLERRLRQSRQHGEGGQGCRPRRPGDRQREPRRPARQLPLRPEVPGQVARPVPGPDAAGRQEPDAGRGDLVPRCRGRRHARPRWGRAQVARHDREPRSRYGPAARPLLRRLRRRQWPANPGRRRRHRLRPAHGRAVRRLGRLAQERPALGRRRQRLHERLDPRCLARCGAGVIRRQRDGRCARQPPAQRPGALRQQRAAGDAERRHVRLGLVHPHRPHQSGRRRCLPDRRPQGTRRARRPHHRPSGAAGLGHRHRPDGAVFLEHRRDRAGTNRGRSLPRQRVDRHRPLQHHPERPERQLLGHLDGLSGSTGHRDLHHLRHHRRRHADHDQQHDGGRRLLLPGADRACRHHRPGGGQALPDQDPLFRRRRRHRSPPRLAAAQQRQGHHPPGVAVPHELSRRHREAQRLG